MPKKNLESISTEKKDTRLSTGHTIDKMERTRDRKGQQPVASADEQAKRVAEMRTQGRKGCKLTRVSLGITPANLKYVDTMSALMGKSRSQFIGYVLEQYQAEHQDNLYDQAVSLQQQLTSEDEKHRKD